MGIEMTQEEIQEFIRNAPAKVGDVVWAWDDMKYCREKGVLVGIKNFDAYPYTIITEYNEEQIFKNITPYTAPKKRPMTHKECFELQYSGWVFRNIEQLDCIRGYWHGSNNSAFWQGCPISELVEPVENSPWRALEVEE